MCLRLSVYLSVRHKPVNLLLQCNSVFLYFSNEDGLCEYSGVAQEYNRCVNAHGVDELEEWRQRVCYRQAKLKISRQHSAVDLTFENVTEFCSDVDGAEVTCDGPLEVHLTEKTDGYTWNFHVQVYHVCILYLVL